jgi:hypothetical protein
MMKTALPGVTGGVRPQDTQTGAGPPGTRGTTHHSGLQIVKEEETKVHLEPGGGGKTDPHTVTGTTTAVHLAGMTGAGRGGPLVGTGMDGPQVETGTSQIIVHPATGTEGWTPHNTGTGPQRPDGLAPMRVPCESEDQPLPILGM